MGRYSKLGTAQVYYDNETGRLVTDTDALRRPFAGGQDFGYDDDDDFGYDDEDDDFGYDDEDDDFGYDEDFEGEEEADFGARGRGRQRRRGRRGRRHQRRSERRARRRGEPEEDSSGWGMTTVGGVESIDDAGSVSVRVRLQHDFKAQDITFEGSESGAKVTSIFFGDRVVWSNPDGIAAAVFGAGSLLRGMLKGQTLKAGLDITVNGSLPGAGDFAATLTGFKPIRS